MTRQSWFVTGAIAFFASLLGIALLFQSGESSNVTASQAGGNPGVSAPASPTPSPSPTTSTPAKQQPPNDGTGCAQKVGKVRVYYANRHDKTSAWAVGPSLLREAIHGTKAQAKAAVAEIWKRMCKDERLTSQTVSGFDPTHNPFPVLTNAEWRKLLGLLRIYGDWDHATLVHLNAKQVRNLRTDHMIPGKVPQLGYQDYTSGPAWFIKVRNILTNGFVYLRVACGGQWTGPSAELPTVIPRF